MPEYSKDMYLKGFSATQIYSAFKQSKRKKKKDDDFLEKEIFAFIQAMLTATVNEAMKDLFKDFK